MAASNGTTALLNPYTPMAFIPPELATKVTTQTYASIGSLSVLLWDILLHFQQDYQLPTRKFDVGFIIYCIARMTSLAYILGLVIVTTAPIGNCDYVRQINILYPFAVPLTIIPFVVRVSALFDKNKYVTAFFCLSWLSVVGGCIAMPIGSFGIRFGTTEHCSHIIKELPNALSSILPLIHDTLIFVATTWAFLDNSYPGVGMKEGMIRIMVLGTRDMSPFARSILRDGQAYYLVTLILNMCFVVLAYVPRTAITACTIGIPHFVIVSNMSSHVFRNMRLGLYQDYTLTTGEINRAVQGPINNNSQSDHEMVFMDPVISATGFPEDGGDLEAGRVRRVEREAGEHVKDVTGTESRELRVKGSSDRDRI